MKETKKQKKVAKVMREFKKGDLHSGKSDKIVTNPKQAVAIALQSAGIKNRPMPKKKLSQASKEMRKKILSLKS